MSLPKPDEILDVAIIGAGPVGLLLANFLGDQKLKVLCLEKRSGPWDHSQAIGITPPSLSILAKLGLDQKFIEQGIKIKRVHVHGQSGRLGVCDFTKIDDPNAFVLALPQRQNMAILEERLKINTTVEILYGRNVHSIVTEGDLVKLLDTAGQLLATAKYVVACDGSRSRLREQLGFSCRGGSYDCHFFMGDFPDSTDLGDEGHLYFTPFGAVESFPLPGGKRRWIVQTHERIKIARENYLQETVEFRTGIKLPDMAPEHPSGFSPRWLNSEMYSLGRVVLCGDAAHVMSPIGGQGMNTGFADAEFLGTILPVILHDPDEHKTSLDAYHRLRSEAAKTATQRAAMGMRLGTWRGRAASILRDILLKYLLLSPALAKKTASRFSMVSIPNRTLEHVPQRELPPIVRKVGV